MSLLAENYQNADQDKIIDFKASFQNYWIDLFLTLVLIGVWVVIHLVYTPVPRFFVERDSELSYPYEPKEDVSDTSLILISVVAPFVIIYICQIIFKFALKADVKEKRGLDFLLSGVSFLSAQAMTFIFSDLLKSFVGRKRPNFFAYCNYKGYRDALASGNFTAYIASTTPGVPGSMNYCLETDQSLLSDSGTSFPSLHASACFCGLLYAGFFIVYLFSITYKKQQSTIKLTIVSFFWSVAAIIAATRPLQYWHFFDDIVCGACIGAFFAALVFSLSYSPTLDLLFSSSNNS